MKVKNETENEERHAELDGLTDIYEKGEGQVTIGLWANWEVQPNAKTITT